MNGVYKVAITRLSDGVTRVLSEPVCTGDTQEVVSFYWGEGNMSCDCNREIFFLRAGGEDPLTGDAPCGDSLYSAKIIDFGGMPEE